MTQATLVWPFHSRNEITSGLIRHSQSGTDCLFLPVSASYVKPVDGSWRASLRNCKSRPGIRPSQRQVIVHLGRWLWCWQWWIFSPLTSSSGWLRFSEKFAGSLTWCLRSSTFFAVKINGHYWSWYIMGCFWFVYTWEILNWKEQ